MDSDSIRSRIAKPGEVAMKAHELLNDDNPRIIDNVCTPGRIKVPINCQELNKDTL